MPTPKPSSKNTLLRHWTMLQSIPRRPQKTTPAELRQKLLAANFPVSLRTVERDLIQLSEVLPLSSDEAKPRGWQWAERAMQWDIPGMEPQVALAFQMARTYLKHLLPAATVDRLAPWFLIADKVLAAHANKISAWPDKIRVLPRGMPQAAAQVDGQIETAVYSALLDERQLAIDYSRNGEDCRSYVIHPLAIVVRDRSIYLVCRFDGHDDVRQLALQRIRRAEASYLAVSALPGFSLDDYIASGEFGIVFDNEKMRLEVLLLSHLEIHFREQPIADDQEIEIVDDEWFRLTASVPNNLETRLWLQSFGAEAEILGPPELRAEFARNARRLARRYRGS